MMRILIILINVSCTFKKKKKNRETEGDLHNLRSKCNRPLNIPHSYIVHCFTNYIICTLLHKHDRYFKHKVKLKSCFFLNFWNAKYLTWHFTHVINFLIFTKNRWFLSKCQVCSRNYVVDIKHKYLSFWWEKLIHVKKVSIMRRIEIKCNDHL